MQTYLQVGLGKMIHVMQWSRPEISHYLRYMTKLMGNGKYKSVDTMHRCTE
jgi:hypothetical protein